MDFNQIIVVVVPAIISGLVSYYSSRRQSKIELKKLEVDVEKMKIQHDQELEKLKLTQRNKEDDLKLKYLDNILYGKADLNNLLKQYETAQQIQNTNKFNKKRRF